MHYCDRSSALFAEPDEAIAARWSIQLRSLYPDLLSDPGTIDEVRVFKAPFVEPIPTLDYSARMPSIQVGDTPVFLATTAQIYPNVTSWNSSVGLANRAAAEVIRHRKRARTASTTHAR